MKPTPDLCDQYPEMVRVVEPMLTNYGGRTQFCGPVVTVKCFEDNSCVKQLVGTPGNGRVLVVDAGGSMRRACLGDMLAEKASNNGWSGIVIYGCIRDVDELMAIDIGVQALGVHPMKTEKKDVGEIDIPVTFGGVTFIPGDFAYADNNGLIVACQELT
ncbi:ribonuclease E activity regulator RraA [bacterium]|jgi:regulator of ribonuclease activity A|nr:ribonuclease E activity regulator RraA [Porticoccaceae bacterium]MDC3261811.1 ribonuclease E activity regulator RraA [bacterium]